MNLFSFVIMLLVLTGDRHASASATSESASQEIRALIASARGAPTVLCEYAARSLQSGWGWKDAPASPLGSRKRPFRSRLTDEDVQFLLSSLDTPDPCVRELAVRLVAEDDRDDVATGLIQRLASSDSSIRTVAALGLGIAAPQRAVDPLIKATNDASVGVRADALWALGRICDSRAVAPATRKLEDRSPIVRETAAATLGHLEATEARPALVKTLHNDDLPGVRRVCAWALVQIEADESSANLATALASDTDASVREMCAWGLGNLDDGSLAVATLLATAKNDKDEDVREVAVWSLAQLGAETAAPVLAELLESDPGIEVRCTAAWALGQLGLGSAPKGLIHALSDGSAKLRLTAAWALSEIGDPAALPALRSALSKEKDPRVCKAMLRALIHSGERSDRLKELLQSNDPEVRKMAVQAVAGKDVLDPWPWPEPRPRPFP
jgi:HEAT repeat protein